MKIQIKEASRKQQKIKILISGVAGSGKTKSSLLLAAGLVNGDYTKIGVIDTEKGSASLYDNLGKFKVIELYPPFTPENYIECIKAFEEHGVEAIIIDSITHEWEGTGGILDEHSKMTGNSFTNWSKLTPRHNKFIEAMLQSSCHVIATARTKADYIISESNGKSKIEKQGTKVITREGMEYEFTLSFVLNLNNYAESDKDRTGLFKNKPLFVITAETGKQIIEWCQSGKPTEKTKPETKQTKQEEIKQESINEMKDEIKQIEKEEQKSVIAQLSDLSEKLGVDKELKKEIGKYIKDLKIVLSMFLELEKENENNPIKNIYVTVDNWMLNNGYKVA